MMFDYFYGNEADKFMFYRIPKLLFQLDEFANLSLDAKLMYGLLLDRVGISTSNGWTDEEGRVYIIFTIEETSKMLGCSQKKAVLIFKELVDFGLVEKKRQGLGKPSLIYVKNFLGDRSELQFMNGKKVNSGEVNSTIHEVSKGQPNNTNINNTEYINNNSIRISEDVDNRNEAMEMRSSYKSLVLDNIQYGSLLKTYPYDRELLDQIVELMVDVICSNAKTIRVGGDDKPCQVVKSVFSKLTYEHVTYVIDGLNENTTKIRNMRQYLIAALYNASLTISAHYSALYNYDHANGLV